MNKFIRHTATICIIIFTISLCPILISFCDKYNDYIYFVNFILSLIVVVSTGLKLFSKIDVEKYITILVCDMTLIIVSNKLYSYETITCVKNNFRMNSTYMSMFEIVTLSIAILCIMKLIIWARSKDKSLFDNKSANNSISFPEHESSSENYSPNTNTTSNATNSFLYITVISLIILSGVIGSVVIIYIFRKQIASGSWIDYIPYLLLIIGFAMGILILLNILTIAARSMIDLIRFRDSRQNKFLDIISKYRLSTTITLILFVAIYLFKGEYTLDALTNLISSDLGDFLSLPLSFCVILSAFFVIVLLIQVILKIFSINVDDFPPDIIEDIGKKILHSVYEIAKKLYFIVIKTINSAIDFAEFIPDYFETLRILVMGSDETHQSSVQQQTSSTSTTNENGDGNDG